jgi:hypothetical protein
VSAKHRRPFYVFAVVAAICSLVLVTGIRSSRADPTPGNVTVAPDTSGAPFEVQRDGRELKPVDVNEQKARVVHAFRDTDGGSGDGSGHSWSGGTETLGATPDSEDGDGQLDPEGDIDGQRTRDGAGGDDPADDDGPSLDARPETQTNTPNEDPDAGEPGTEEDPDEEEPTGPQEETEDPSDEGEGLPDEDLTPSPNDVENEDQS